MGPHGEEPVDRHEPDEAECLIDPSVGYFWSTMPSWRDETTHPNAVEAELLWDSRHWRG